MGVCPARHLVYNSAAGISAFKRTSKYSQIKSGMIDNIWNTSEIDASRKQVRYL